MIQSNSLALALSFLLMVTAGPVFADTSPPPIPETPAGLAFSDWFDAHNSGDRARYQSFIKGHSSWLTEDSMAQWRAETGPYDLLEVSSNEPSNVFFRVKQRLSGVEEFGRLQVSVAEPDKVMTLDVRRIPAGAKVETITIDDAASARIAAQVANLLDRFHLDPKIGKSLSAAVRKRAAHGDYRSLTYGEQLSRKLTEDLREVGNDKHLEVRFSYFIPPAKPPERDAVADERMRAANCGFEKAEHLRPNIGYLKFNFFGDPDICTATAGAAMNFLADSDSLVIDLRDNNGGRGGMGTFIASYLFAERTQLSSNFRRADNTTTEEWTLPYVPGRKFTGKPVFVLISSRTFSAGEGFAYILKDLKRAMLIGETTVGGSGTIEFKPIDDHFTLVVPTGRVISPVTKTDWSGGGVEPDVKVAADEALEVALKLATVKVEKNPKQQ